ncbi:solute:sodium symporter family transporter [Butyricicoccus pullicaecorum]|uniref:Solute:sodium symporter family transporter n=1 Tax=Butyricicoccus pullicaecorum TaxID=501571 RepID=A0A1Y4LCX8_9FIRM|nr:solute:sodium symporter family transporter [Butyricicoccus pullicaecorum]OUP52701.1 solute:sodium symporter family transporter [Butyricicoccus pullicaecorum]
MNLMFTAVTFVAFTALVAIISWWKTRGDNLDTQDGYYLAGRGLTGPVIAGSLLMTNLSAEQLVGNNGQAVRIGMSPMGWEVTSAIALVILAFVLMPKYLKTGLTTVPEFFEQRYDAGTRRLVSFIVLLSYIIIMLPNVLYAGAQVFVNIFGIDQVFVTQFGMDAGSARFWAIAAVCVATAFAGSIYAIFGGLKAIAVSDSINGLGLIVGGLLVPIFGLIALGAAHGGGFMEGLDAFLNTDKTLLNAIDAPNLNEPYLPWPLLLTGLLVNNMYFWATNQSIIQRTFGAKNLKEAQKGAVLAGFFKILTPLIIVVPGVIARLLYTEVTDWGNGDTAYPMLVADVMPKWLLGFFAAVMFGAILSSFNSILNSASTIYALDIHRPMFNPNATDAHMVKVGQNFGTIVAIISTVMSPFFMYMGGITTTVNSAFAAFNTPLFVCLLCGFFWKKVPANAAKIVIPIHVVLYFLLQFYLRYQIPFLENTHYLYFTAFLFVIDMIIMCIIVKVHPRETDFVLHDAQAVDLTPWKNGKYVAAFVLAIMCLAYVIFSPLCLGA